MFDWMGNFSRVERTGRNTGDRNYSDCPGCGIQTQAIVSRDEGASVEERPPSIRVSIGKPVGHFFLN